MRADSVPRASVALFSGVGRFFVTFLLQGGGHCRVHRNSVADLSDGFQCYVAASDRPFVVLFQHKRANEANDGGLIGEDPDHIGAALDFLVEPFQRVGGMDFRLEYPC